MEKERRMAYYDPRSLAEHQSIDRALDEQRAAKHEEEIRRLENGESSVREWIEEVNAYIATLYDHISHLEQHVRAIKLWRSIALGSLLLCAILIYLILSR